LKDYSSPGQLRVKKFFGYFSNELA